MARQYYSNPNASNQFIHSQRDAVKDEATLERNKMEAELLREEERETQRRQAQQASAHPHKTAHPEPDKSDQ